MPPGECESTSARDSTACEADLSFLTLADKLSNGHTSTFYHGQQPTPTAHAPAKSSQCVKQQTIKAAKYPAATRKVKVKARRH